MAIKDKLQKLLKKVTNKDIKGDNIEEVIADATEKYEGGGSGGGVSLYNILVYCSVNTYPLYFTMQVDDNTLETYDDLYDYLVNKGLVMTEDYSPEIPAIGSSSEYGDIKSICVSTFEGDEYIYLNNGNGQGMYLFSDTPVDFSITYLGQEN